MAKLYTTLLVSGAAHVAISTKTARINNRGYGAKTDAHGTGPGRLVRHRRSSDGNRWNSLAIPLRRAHHRLVQVCKCAWSSCTDQYPLSVRLWGGVRASQASRRPKLFSLFFLIRVRARVKPADGSRAQGKAPSIDHVTVV